MDNRPPFAGQGYMLRRCSNRLISAAAFLAVLVQPGMAQVIRSPYGFVEDRQALVFFAGYIVTNRGQADLGPGSGPLQGLRYTIRPAAGPVELETQVGWFPAERKVQGLTALDMRTQVATASLSLLLLDAGLRFNLTGPRTYRGMKPYLIAGGGGLIQLTSERPPEEVALPGDLRYRFGTRFTGHLGGGVEWLAFQPWALRLDLRNMLWKIEAPDGFLVADPVLPTGEWVQNFLINLGLGLRF